GQGRRRGDGRPAQGRRRAAIARVEEISAALVGGAASVLLVGGDMTERSQKAFPVSWDQFHRDARALAWRLAGAGPFTGLVAITRGGLVPAAIIARELDLRVVETVCIASYHDYKTQGGLQVLKTVGADIVKLGDGKSVLIVDDLVDTGATAKVVRE